MPQLSLNSITLGDALEQMKLIPDHTVDCVLTDLPYGTTSNKWDSVIPMDQLWAAWKRICKPGAPIILFTQMPFTITVGASAIGSLRSEWIWQKPQGTGFLNANRYPLKSHENILVFCDKAPPYYPQKETGHKPYKTGRGRSSTNYRKFDRETETINLDGTRFPKTVLSFNQEKGLHPTQKPVALCEYLIQTYTLPGAVILDCTCGSGTTAIACINTDRQFICIERDGAIFAIAEKRIVEAQEKLSDAQVDRVDSPVDIQQLDLNI